MPRSVSQAELVILLTPPGPALPHPGLPVARNQQKRLSHPPAALDSSFLVTIPPSPVGRLRNLSPAPCQPRRASQAPSPTDPTQHQCADSTSDRRLPVGDHTATHLARVSGSGPLHLSSELAPKSSEQQWSSSPGQLLDPPPVRSTALSMFSGRVFAGHWLRKCLVHTRASRPPSTATSNIHGGILLGWCGGIARIGTLC